MWVGVIRAELRLPGMRSLKEKRRPLKSLLAYLHDKLQCAASEVDHADKHQRVAVGVSCISNNRKHLAERMGEVRRFLETHPACLLLDFQQQVLPGPDAFGREGLQDLWADENEADSDGENTHAQP